MQRFFRSNPRRGLQLTLGVLLMASASGVMATLGSAPSTVASTPTLVFSAKKLAATATGRSGTFTLSESQFESGTLVREYVTPAGQVFALAWRGPVLPDLSAYLGGYFNAFKVEAQQARTKGIRGSPVHFEGDGFVMRSGGRMRNFSGYAYVPTLVPAGVNINDVLQ